uniref:Protein TIFY n=1 Tax=Kalanchoe fedtschenkoi TaxID=63787 RepID=A0A7N0ZVU9_KALFE
MSVKSNEIQIKPEATSNLCRHIQVAIAGCLRHRNSVFIKILRDSNLPVTQLTIFYSGKVNVYDDVSRDKAQSLIQLAASPLNFLADSTSDGTPVPQPFVSLPQCINTKASPIFLTSNLQPSQTVKVVDNGLLQREEGSMYKEGNQEGASSRKACVQRYLEKRKDRSRFKRKVGMSSPSSLDGYLNQRMMDIGHNEQSGHSDIYCSSSPLPSLPHFPTQCCPAGNTVGDLNLSANNTGTSGILIPVW